MTDITLDFVKKHGHHPRVHGNGFLIVDLPVGRLHFWGHPLIPRQVVRSSIHDHRFSFQSTVVRGSIIDALFSLDKSAARPTHSLCVAEPIKGVEDTTLVPTGIEGVPRQNYMTYVGQGESYNMSAGVLHDTFLSGPAVTYMVKTSTTKIRPRVLVPIDQKPDNDFKRDSMPEADVWRVITEMLA